MKNSNLLKKLDSKLILDETPWNFSIASSTAFSILKKLNKKGTKARLDLIMEDILCAYGHRYRFYHGLDHLENCLKELEEIKDKLKYYYLAGFALLFHDIVCLPDFTHNEEVSAHEAVLAAEELGLDYSSQAIINFFIMITSTDPYKMFNACPDYQPWYKEAFYIRDIDLSILGQDFDKFMRYEEGIKKEYLLFYDGYEYKEGREIFLSDLLNKEIIYSTEYFYKKYENKARQNIKKLLRKL